MFKKNVILLKAENLQTETVSWPCDLEVPRIPHGMQNVSNFAAANLGRYSYVALPFISNLASHLCHQGLIPPFLFVRCDFQGK
jgi:hypothetical protein